MEKIYQKGNSKIFKYKFTSEEINFIIDCYLNKHYGSVKISRLLHVAPTTINDILHKNGVQMRDNRNKSLHNTCDEHYFDVIDTEHKAYWLGFLYSDGYVSSPRKYSSGKVGLSLHVDDIEILYKLKTDLQYTGNINRYEQTTTYGTTNFGRLVIPSNVLYDAVVEKGVLPHKTFILTFPSVDILPPSLIPHFIRGYLDGDGSIIINSRQAWKISFIGTRELLSGIAAVLGKTNIKLDQKKKHKIQNKNNYALVIGGKKQVYNIIKYLYKDATIYLTRKKKKADIILAEGEGKYE